MIRPAQDWFASRGWKPFEFQKKTWRAYLAGKSGLVHAPTGLGKTYAVWLGPVIERIANAPAEPPPKPDTGADRPKRSSKRADRERTEPLTVLWLTPLRALASDTLQALQAPITDLKLPWSIEKRTGDTGATLRKYQRERLPTALITTPESLSVLLSYPEAYQRFKTLRCVIVDEWHELLNTKRGVQTELGLARLRTWNPALRSWGLSATLGNLDQARDVLLGNSPARDNAILIEGPRRKRIEIATLIPDNIERFPWYGHLGTKLVPQVLAVLERARSALFFTNTRSQAELWFRGLLTARPDLIGQIALHHGSLDRKLRDRTETLLRQGKLRCVVCTSSLDLGVDFSPVDTVLQIGSPKGIARLLQRAGRSGHQPGAVSRIFCVPTHAFELIEFAAARDALHAGQIEPRLPLDKPLDVLAQHLVTVAAGGGFDERELINETRTTHAYQHLTDEEWGWCIDFTERGGDALTAYPEYARIRRQNGRLHASSPTIARRHRMGIGTISSNQSMNVRLGSGKTLGTIEESFIARLAPGDVFVFAGRLLQLLRVRDMTAYVRKARTGRGNVPRWAGSRFPLSTQLGAAVRDKFAAPDRLPSKDHEEMRAAWPLIQLQRAWSRLPRRDRILIEVVRHREGEHWFIFPFEGRLVHEGLAALLAYRIAQRRPQTVNMTSNDYGMNLHAPGSLELEASDWHTLLTPERLAEDLLACLNATELARRQFRDIARIAGLIFPDFPGRGKTSRQLQASSDLFFDVFADFDPGNLLLEQARREVLEQQLEIARLKAALERVRAQPLEIVRPGRLTPLAFPLWAETLRAHTISTEKWSDRVQKMALKLEAEADQDRSRKRSRA